MVRRIASMLAAVLLSSGGFVSAAQGPHPHACDDTSRAVRRACDAGVADDFGIAKGNCANVADAAERQQCMVDARDARTEAQQECRDQFHARQDLCSDLGQAPYDPEIVPADFTTQVTNQYFPLVPGTVRTFKGGGETETVTVTNEIKMIQGVETVVVQDEVVNDATGKKIEITQDFFAQRVADASVWYFGEITQSISEDGLISTDGSFLAGVDGAKAGIIMEGTPQVGDVYRQEFSLGEAEDAAEVTATDGNASGNPPGASCSRDCVVTRDFTPLEPGGDEQKFYAPGVGVILEIDSEGVRNELQ